MKTQWLLLISVFVHFSLDSQQSSEVESKGRRPKARIQPPQALVVPNLISTDLLANVGDFDEKAKRKEVKNLVDNAIKFLQDNPEHKAFSAFTHDKAFRIGDMYVFVYDTDGILLAQGDSSSTVWSDGYTLKDQFGTPIVQLILEEARSPKEGGWVTYNWRNSTKNSYVKEVVKNNQTYVVGAGYYSHSKEDAVIGLVKGSVALFNDIVKRDMPIEAAFSVMSYPKGRFILGDLYLFALGFDGVVFANGEQYGTIGKNDLDYKDAQGVYINQEIIKRLRESTTGIWIEYQSKGALKKTYAQMVSDKTGKRYFIACGYYPNSTRDQVTALVARGYQYLERHGETQAVREFSKSKRLSAFVLGDLYLYLFSMDGTCLAHGGNEELIGKNLMNSTDDNGVPYVKDLIEKAQAGGGWVDYKIKNSFLSAYVEKAEVGLKNYVIGSGIFPVSKFETQVLLTKGAVGELRLQPTKFAFAEFANPVGKFLRGDLGIFVLDASGILYVYKDRNDLVWKNIIDAQDDDGKPYIKMMIEQATKGPGIVNYRLMNGQAMAYIEPFIKDGKRYIVGSEGYR